MGGLGRLMSNLVCPFIGNQGIIDLQFISCVSVSIGYDGLFILTVSVKLEFLIKKSSKLGLFHFRKS